MSLHQIVEFREVQSLHNLQKKLGQKNKKNMKDFHMIDHFVEHLKEDFLRDTTIELAADSDDFRTYVHQTGATCVSALLELLRMRHVEFQSEMSNKEKEEHAKSLSVLQERLRIILKRDLIDAFLQKYLRLTFPEYADYLKSDYAELLLLVTPALSDDDASFFLAMLMHESRPPELSLWAILSEDKDLACRCHLALLSPKWSGTWTELLTIVVDEIIVPQTRRWKERSVVHKVPGMKIPGDCIGLRPYYSGNGVFFASGVRVAYGEQGEIVAKVDKTHFKVKFADNLVQLKLHEVRPSLSHFSRRLPCYLRLFAQLSTTPPPPLLCNLRSHDKLYYYGRTETFGQDVLKFGYLGEVMGPAKFKPMKSQGIAMHFTGMRCIVDCYLSEVRFPRFFSHAAFSSLFFLFLCAQLSPFPPTSTAIREAGIANKKLSKEQEEWGQKSADADAMMLELLREEHEEHEKTQQRPLKSPKKSSQKRSKQRCNKSIDNAALAVDGIADAAVEKVDKVVDTVEKVYDVKLGADSREFDLHGKIRLDEAFFYCPITTEIMKDPVMTVSGFTYERRAIEDWFQNNATDPETGLELESKALFPNRSLHSMISEFLETRS